MYSGVSHYYDTGIAAKYGIPEAILIAHFVFWIDTNKRKGANEHDGRTWMYSTIEAIAEQFEEFNPRQVEHIVNKLCRLGVLMKGNYNRLKMDRTRWYAFVDESTFVRPNTRAFCKNEGRIPKLRESISETSGMLENTLQEFSETTSSMGISQICGSNTIYTDRKPDRVAQAPTPPKKKKALRFKKCPCSESELQGLYATYGEEPTKAMVQRIEDHCASKDVDYADWPATIRIWFGREATFHKPSSQKPTNLESNGKWLRVLVERHGPELKQKIGTAIEWGPDYVGYGSGQAYRILSTKDWDFRERVAKLMAHANIPMEEDLCRP